MITNPWRLVNYYNAEREEVVSSELDGDFYGGYSTMPIDHLLPNICGKDLFYDVALKELSKYKELLLEGKVVSIYVELDFEDDFSKIIACRILKVEVTERSAEI